MQTFSCPICGEILPRLARYCARCGELTPSPEATLHLRRTRSGCYTPAGCVSRQGLPEDREPPLLETTDNTSTFKQFHKQIAWPMLSEEELEPFYDAAVEEQDDEVVEQRATWQKVVEHKTPGSLPAVALSPPGRSKRASFWPDYLKQRMSSHLFFWLSLIVLLTLLLGGTFGVAVGFGREVKSPIMSLSTLQVSPATVALGGIVTLRGASFTPGGTIELSRDKHIYLTDTGGANAIQADIHGFFSDTVIVDPAWLAGKHMLYATDLATRRQATFPLLVAGSDVLQGPPHLLLSSSMLDLGMGDEATNSSKLLALSNAGGDQLIWKASVGQPWLQITPQSGSIASGEHMSAIVAVDRSALTPGIYSSSIVFISNTEQVRLLVSMKVLPLQPAHEAILQLSSAALIFTATQRGTDPQNQVVTVSNPGIRPLVWDTAVNLQNGRGWLWVTPPAGNVNPGSRQAITVNVSIRGLAPGVYKGTILFFNQGSKTIQGSPQSIYVSLTIAPPCTLTLTSSNLSFIGVHGQASPVSSTLYIGVAQGCTTNQFWSASTTTVNGGNWLSISQANGSTPAQSQVSVNSAGLAPGTYAGTLTFTSKAGQQIVPVTLVINPVACMITAPNTLALQGTSGQSGLASQSATLSSSGDCLHTLNWTSTVSVVTPSGGRWLSTPSSGSFAPLASSNMVAQADLVGLSANTYTGTVTLTAVDSVTGQPAGTLQIAVTLTVLPQCTLQTPSAPTLTFSASVGANPATPTASITVGVTGNCSGNVTITPTVDAGGSGWLTIATGPVTVSSGGQATLTVTITSSALAAGSHSSTITLVATDSNGPIAASPQAVSVSLTVQ